MDQFGLVEIGGIGALVMYIVWIVLFFGTVRPRVMQWVGEQIGVSVRESTDMGDAGSYEVAGKAPLQKHGAILLLDLITLLLGTVGVCALISIPGFLFAESGAPYRWEGILFKTGARIADAHIPPMQDGQAATIIVVQSESDIPMQGCMVSTDGYSARNGYLTGTSAYFDLSSRETRNVEMEISAAKPIAGTYEIVLKLECKNRIKEKVRTRITVDS